MADMECRACGGQAGEIVLDLGLQPACDYFPACDDVVGDPLYPLQMWLCSSCGLAQLLFDPGMPEEPKGTEPLALVEQAVDAVEHVAAAGWLPPSGRIAEYGSPHGGSWLELVRRRGLIPVAENEPADVVLDCFGMMHASDQSAALAERVARVAPGGALLMQYHPLATIMRLRQWNALRHGHFAYYSTAALVRMLAAVNFSPRTVWQFELYGGTVLLAATRDVDSRAIPDRRVRTLLAHDAALDVANPVILRGLQYHVVAHVDRLCNWLLSQQAAGLRVVGYGAASRAVALLRRAHVDRTLLPAVVDASPGKQGLRMPGTDIPIVGPGWLSTYRPDAVLLFLPDLLAEVRVAIPEVEASGGRWVDAEALGTENQPPQHSAALGHHEAN